MYWHLSSLFIFCYRIFEKSTYTWFYLFNELIIYFMMPAFYDLAGLHDWATPCGSEHGTKPWRVITHGRIFSLLVRFEKLTLANTSSYSSEERLVAIFLLHKETAEVRRWIRWFHSCRNYLRIHLRADQPTVREFLKETFPGQWIGRGSATSPSPIFWPPRSRDLTTLDNYLWRIIKDEVAVRHCYTNAQLRSAITYTSPSLTSHIPQKRSQGKWRSISLFADHEGADADPLDPLIDWLID